MRIYEKALCADCKDPRIIISLTLDEAREFWKKHHPREAASLAGKLDNRLLTVIHKAEAKLRTAP